MRLPSQRGEPLGQRPEQVRARMQRQAEHDQVRAGLARRRPTIAATASRSSAEPESIRTFTEQVISAGSRPIDGAVLDQRPASGSSQSAGSAAIAFHCCAHRAVVRSVLVLPRPPIVIGGCGRCTGFGSQ